MRQVHHLFVVDPERRVALAKRVGPGWLLPVLCCGEKVRVAPLVSRWCFEQRLRGDVAGQWLGSSKDEVTDWLVVVSATADSAAPDGLAWMPLDTLASEPGAFGYQQRAVRRVCVGHSLPSVDGPFGNLAWPGRARARITAATGSAPDAVTPYRTSPYEVVLGAECAQRRVYLKGFARGRAAEARLTQALAEIAPDSFAVTLALEEDCRGVVWWLADGCKGVPAANPHVVAAALAHVQQRVIEAGLESLPLVTIDLDAAAEWASELLGDPACGAVVRDACARAMDLPHSWIPLDLDPTNVLVDGHRAVRFIDVDDSFFGPAALAMTALAQRYGVLDAGDACAVYAQSWSPSLARIDWKGARIAAAVFQVWRGWNRLREKVARGEVDAALDQVETRIRARLARTIHATVVL